MDRSESRRRKVRLVSLAIVLAIGVFLRIPSSTLTDAAAPLRVVHLNTTMKGIGFDENLYRTYVNVLISRGITSYPDLAEEYVAVQDRLTSAILPPTRFLYIFAAYLWHQIWGTEALSSLKAVASLFSILLLIVSTLFAWRLAGARVAPFLPALMGLAPTPTHMSHAAALRGFFPFSAQPR